ncbi:hypothetical protein [Paraburkholderia youngii]|uniref:hypothetical protein n=1 Tax=Paraburkholderia youngii TaxID=2782701 RepID=UPI003D1DD249
MNSKKKSTPATPPRYPLFHGTGVYALAAIIQTDSLLEGANWARMGESHGPRLARTASFAAQFITYSMHWGEGGVLVLDGERLRSDYKIESYLDVDVGGDPWPDGEMEEVVLTPCISTLQRYIVSIVCDPMIIRAAMSEQFMQCAIDGCGWSFTDESFGPAREALQNLLAHPLLNVRAPEGGPPRQGNWDLDPETGRTPETDNHTAPIDILTRIADAMATGEDGDNLLELEGNWIVANSEPAEASLASEPV